MTRYYETEQTIPAEGQQWNHTKQNLKDQWLFHRYFLLESLEEF